MTLPIGPSFFTWPICDMKSSRVKFPFSIFSWRRRVSASSNLVIASLTRPRMSPMPRMRCAMPSGRNSSSMSSFSPTPRNFTGLPVIILALSSAPPRVSESNLVRISPSISSCSLKALALLTASWPLIESSTR